METQNEAIIKHLKAGNSITALDALRQFNCLRLAARISDIKQRGYDVQSKWIVKKNKKYKQYSFGRIDNVSSTNRNTLPV